MSAASVGPYILPPAAIREGELIETHVRRGEDGVAMHAELNRWFAFYRATSPITIWMIARAFRSWNQLRRIRVCEAATRRLEIDEAQRWWDDAQFAKVQEHERNLKHAPADAIRELQGFAAGCRWLINRLQRLKGLIEKDGTLYGADRDEAIRLRGAEPVFERLRESDPAWLTWGYCLFSQPNPDRDEMEAFMASGPPQPSLPTNELIDLSDPQSTTRKLFIGSIERDLTALRQREEWFWVNHEEPARTAAIEQALAKVAGKLRQLASYERQEEKSLKQMLASVVKECKRTGVELPRRAPYKPF